jgi:AraC-like DNA-binding protein
MLEIYFWNGRFLFKGSESSGTYHKHCPIQIIVSVEEKITVSTTHGLCVCSNVLLIGSNVKHLCQDHTTGISVFIDPETYEGQVIKQKYMSAPLNTLPFDRIKDIAPDLELFRRTVRSDCGTARSICDRILYSYVDKNEKFAPTDARVSSVLERLPYIPDKKISVKELASAVYLSETRLIHLFKETIGIPIRRYLLWKRLIDAVVLIKGGASFTTAAHEAGFSDYAHLSRTFKHMFGSNVEEIFKNDQFVQVNNCEN